MEGSSKRKIRLKEGDRGGHGLKKDRSAIEEEEKEGRDEFFVQMLG